MTSIDSETNRQLKDNVNVGELFCIYLAQLIRSRDEMNSPDVYSYKPSNLDAMTRSQLKAQVKAALARPQDTSAYRYIKSGNDSETAEEDALRYTEFAGHIVQAILGEKNKIPDLLNFIRKNHKDVRARTIISGVLFYLTGQDIGGFFLLEEDLDLWEEWWEQNKSTLACDVG